MKKHDFNYRRANLERLDSLTQGNARRYSELCYELLGNRTEKIEDMTLFEEGRGEKYEQERKRARDSNGGLNSHPRGYGELIREIQEIYDRKGTPAPGNLKAMGLDALYLVYFDLKNITSPQERLKLMDMKKPQQRRTPKAGIEKRVNSTAQEVPVSTGDLRRAIRKLCKSKNEPFPIGLSRMGRRTLYPLYFGFKGIANPDPKRYC